MGGTLEITARFEDARVVLNNIGEPTPAHSHPGRRA
jgi:hypothetical protein